MMFNGVRSAIALAGIALVVAAGSAFGTTLTFDDVPNEGDALYDENYVSFYEEQGVRVSSGSGAVAYDRSAGSVLVADSGTGFSSDLTFTTGGTFSVQSLNIRSLGYTFSGFVRTLKDNIRPNPTFPAPTALDLTMDPAPVPLPATAPLLAAGGLALFGLARRRRA